MVRAVLLRAAVLVKSKVTSEGWTCYASGSRSRHGGFFIKMARADSRWMHQETRRAPTLAKGGRGRVISVIQRRSLCVEGYA